MKKNKIIIAISILLTISATMISCSNGSKETLRSNSKNELSTSEEELSQTELMGNNNFEYSIPDDWIESEKKYTETMINYVPKSNTESLSYVTVSVHDELKASSIKELYTFAEELEGTIKDSLENFKNYKYSDTKIGEYDVVVVEYSFSLNEVNYDEVLYLPVTNDNLVLVGCNNSNEGYNLEDVAKQIINTLEKK